MKRIILLVTVALVMALMMAVAAPAFATVHPISESENSAAAADGTPADTQNPPGITGEGHEPGYTDPDPDNATEAQPLVKQQSNKTDNDLHAWK
jgi:uncharacterized low-complexity protein